MDDFRDHLHIGTSGWSYKHWEGIFYPADVRPAQYLEYYLARFACVELNSSFYHLPKSSTVEGWIRRTPDNFKFCPKISRFISHQKRLAGCEEALRRFFEVFGAMKTRLGPVLIQLPPGLSFDKPLIRDFLDVLKSLYNQYRFAIEIRHSTWIDDQFFELLHDFELAFVIADSGVRFPSFEAVTTDFVYLRFHGRESLYASDYGDPVLLSYAEKIIDWLKTKQDVWIFFNNDFNGYAVKNALKLKELVSSME